MFSGLIDLSYSFHSCWFSQNTLGIARACATLNDLDVASYHVVELEKILLASITEGFQQTAEAAQLKACVKNLSPVKDSYKNAIFVPMA